MYAEIFVIPHSREKRREKERKKERTDQKNVTVPIKEFKQIEALQCFQVVNDVISYVIKNIWDFCCVEGARLRVVKIVLQSKKRNEQKKKITNENITNIVSHKPTTHHSEARKSPHVDGVVLRYVIIVYYSVSRLFFLLSSPLTRLCSPGHPSSALLYHSSLYFCAPSSDLSPLSLSSSSFSPLPSSFSLSFSSSLSLLSPHHFSPLAFFSVLPAAMRTAKRCATKSN